MSEDCNTKKSETRRIPSKHYTFRLKLLEALEVDETIKNEFGGNVTQFWRSLLKDRAMLAKHRRERAAEVANSITRYGLTPKDLIDAGLQWGAWTTQK